VKEFDDWFYEQEGFALRAERFYDEMDLMTGGAPEANIKIVKWLRAAYEVGYEHGRVEGPWLRTDDGKVWDES